MNTWQDFILGLGKDIRPEQEAFHKRTDSFMKTDKHVLLNPGGMGLGKTLATCKVLLDNTLNHEFFFIANPTSPLKTIWSNTMNECKMSPHMIWFPKSEMCIKKRAKPSFDESKNCNDDCEYTSEIWADRQPKEKCNQLLSSLKLPTYPDEYYKKQGSKNCLLHVCRYGLKTRKFLIGDFFGVLNSTMFNLITRNKDVNRNKSKAVLIVDEAHLLPHRAKDYLTRSISLDKAIREIEKEIQCDYLVRANGQLWIMYKGTLNVLKKIRNKLLKQTKEKKEDLIRYSYNSFRKDYKDLKTEHSFNFEELEIKMLELAKRGHGYADDYEKEDDPYCVKFSLFLRAWKEKSKDENYSEYFQYSMRNKENISLLINCQDTSDYLFNSMSKWGRVILNSGTISNLDWFKHHTGLENLDVQYEDHIESFSIKDDVLIHPIGNFKFTGGYREKTYDENKEKIISLTSNLSGRTIIFVQSKKDSSMLENQLRSTGKKIINFCLEDDGFETSKKHFERCMGEFNLISEGIAIMSINGHGTVGHNFKNKAGESVSNIIIYGYPFPMYNLLYRDELEYLEKKLGDKALAYKWMSYVPVLDKIYQACTRAKRDETDNPIIILWDNQFGKQAYDYMPDNLKGEMIYDFEQLLNLVRLKDEQR